jgi:hypothetical protein
VEQFKEIYDFSNHHREEVEKSALVGCFSCLIMFTPNDIFEWVDGERTALCPHCGVDAVLPDTMGVELTHDLLRGMNGIWFSEMDVPELTQEMHDNIFAHIDKSVVGEYNRSILHMYLLVLKMIHIDKGTVDMNSYRKLWVELKVPLPESLT